MGMGPKRARRDRLIRYHPRITGGAIDSIESNPGPIYFQGDHTGGIRYRNITISVPRR